MCRAVIPGDDVDISFKNALGIHEQALFLRSRRAEVLGNNLANADTPNFKARDIDFSGLLQQAQAEQQGTNSTTGDLEAEASTPLRTNPRHMSFSSDGNGGRLLYIVPSQPSIDGNTVEQNQEMARFAKNAMDFQASLYFLSESFKGLKLAINGQ